MDNTPKKFSFVVFCILLLLFPSYAQAVIPPDFIFNIGSQVAQFFGAILLFFSATFGIVYQFIKVKLSGIHQKWILGFSIGTIAILLSFGLALWYGNYEQKMQYEKWVQESALYANNEEAKNSLDDSSDSILTVQTEIVSSTENITSTTTPEEINTEEFFEIYKDIPLNISNENFKIKIENKINDYIVLDAREDVEYENGHFPASTHIRFADVKEGRWEELPKDKFVYVMCWSGIRGKEVTEFLRSKNIVGVYLENGANGWYEFGGIWQGKIKFLERYTEPQFQRVYTTKEVKNFVQQGVRLIDSREPSKFRKSHINGSVNIPMFYTPTTEIENLFSQVPAGSRVITICDDYVNCFDAKITGVEAEKRDLIFLGRYTTPWEYGK